MQLFFSEACLTTRRWKKFLVRKTRSVSFVLVFISCCLYLYLFVEKHILIKNPKENEIIVELEHVYIYSRYLVNM